MTRSGSAWRKVGEKLENYPRKLNRRKKTVVKAKKPFKFLSLSSKSLLNLRPTNVEQNLPGKCSRRIRTHADMEIYLHIIAIVKSYRRDSVERAKQLERYNTDGYATLIAHRRISKPYFWVSRKWILSRFAARAANRISIFVRWSVNKLSMFRTSWNMGLYGCYSRREKIFGVYYFYPLIYRNLDKLKRCLERSSPFLIYSVV